ncbi:hypothetical protein GCM10022198_09190 [Klugiella xanthotipulae]|uniref:Ketoacyl-synthetase-like protein n=1 Tax=Klugiella xanthotipulae TaxID=244735 RepID=A0A543I641_9MICO|nr:beta-ketoacyl synthase N-terminal-like domain-containing protein [Klugiella xanthotipulae]TQM66048.1 ketoacyl-synthetase-like protein [Klugiella xanthotipulae]
MNTTSTLTPTAPSTRTTPATPTPPVAIIGMACRLPGASTLDDFWSLIESGRTTFEPVPRDDSLRYGFSDTQLADPAFVPVRSTLDGYDAFDNTFFGISSRDAALMDPQQRVFLETVWSALNDAGVDYSADNIRVGLFGSTSTSTYLSGPITEAGMWDANDLNFSAMLANDKDFLCTRTSYTLGLTGPSVVVQSACSSSLLAVHLAATALRRGECDYAVVGGVSISLPHLGGYLARAGSIFSPTGTCQPFDTSANGTVKAHGAGAVVLCADTVAAATGAQIYAQVAGSATNNDGRDKVGFPAPSVSGQAAAIAEAVRSSGVPVSDLGYIETHGTGTALGDPIEIRALTRALGRQPSDSPIALGSLKASMGHLDAAAGVSALIKTALVLHHGVIPPLAGFTTPHPRMGLAAAAFEACAQPTVVPGGVAAAGVSSFGMGGTNVHVVLRRAEEPSEATAAASTDPDDSPHHELRRDRHWVSAFGSETGSTAAGAAATGTAAPTPTVLEADAEAPTGARNDARGTTTPTRPDEVLTGILTLVSRMLAMPELSPDDDLFDAGADSLTAIDLLAELADRFTVDLAYGDLERARTVRAIAQTVSERQAGGTTGGTAPDTITTRTPSGGSQHPTESARNLIPILRRGPRTLFLAHPAGGTTTCYADLARHLAGNLSIVGLSFPDEYRHRDLTMRQLAARYIAAIREQQPEGPYLIGGYSFGGNLAAEMALQLDEAGETVEQLVLIDAHPAHAYTAGDCGEAAYVAAFPSLLESLVPGIRFDPAADPARSHGDVLESVLSPEWSAGMRRELSAFFDIWQNNHGVLKRWTPDRMLDCPVLILEATQPEPPEVLARLNIAPTSVHEWDRYVRGAIRYARVPGDHYSIFRDDDSLRILGKALDDEFSSL